jgi:hypothetical protein
VRRPSSWRVSDSLHQSPFTAVCSGRIQKVVLEERHRNAPSRQLVVRVMRVLVTQWACAGDGYTDYYLAAGPRQHNDYWFRDSRAYRNCPKHETWRERERGRGGGGTRNLWLLRFPGSAGLWSLTQVSAFSLTN